MYLGNPWFKLCIRNLMSINRKSLLLGPAAVVQREVNERKGKMFLRWISFLLIECAKVRKIRMGNVPPNFFKVDCLGERFKDNGSFAVRMTYATRLIGTHIYIHRSWCEKSKIVFTVSDPVRGRRLNVPEEIADLWVRGQSRTFFHKPQSTPTSRLFYIVPRFQRLIFPHCAPLSFSLSFSLSISRTLLLSLSVCIVIGKQISMAVLKLSALMEPSIWPTKFQFV